MKFVTSLLMVFSLTVTVSPAQSLKEIAKSQGGSATNMLTVDFDVVTTRELLSLSDLVLYARITEVRALLIKDDSLVATDYDVVPLRIVKQNRALNTAVKPVAVPQVTIRLSGGTLMDGAYRYSTKVDVFPETESFRIGEEVVVFLRYQSESNVYNLAYGPFGAFRVVAGHVTPMTAEVSERRGDTPVALAAFLDDLSLSSPRGK